MTLKAIIDSDEFGELEEGVKSLYAEGEDGKYMLDVEGVDDLPAVQGLKSGHQRSKQEKRELKKQLDAIKRKAGPLADLDDIDLSDVDEERIQSLLPYLTGEKEFPSSDDKDTDPKHKVDVDKIKANAVKPYERKLSEIEQERDGLRNELHRHIRDSALTTALSKEKIDEPYFDAAMALFRSRVKVVEDEGKLVPMIEDETMGEVPVDKFVKEWGQTDQGKAFKQAAGNTGGGGRGGNGSGKVKNPWSPDNWNMTEQGRITREDPERARKMASEYGKRIGA